MPVDPVPLSLLNDFLYCRRRAAIKEIEGIRRENMHTLMGDFAHAQADLPGYEVAKGITVLRAVRVWSDRLTLSGKCDIVEKHHATLYLPVEYKKGKRRVFENDDVQLCAQAICLEEMLNVTIPEGAVFHASSKRRRQVVFTAELRAATEQAARLLQSLIQDGNVPPAELKPICGGCSLKEVCLPELSCAPSVQLFHA